ncbi:zf-TFIIB domain-containing protein [Undibacterium seohonense]|uniref:Zf-TFIIB domain-containing protein n=1 Tax=Undibacterium seohonense TaxID=1344950 RepID=A0ABR6X3P0_9BURK|nr:zf-TFIIB domain-containing protein [Undibacterium seohonense]MBC3807558.1 zf-TFIIB domain-containing protein [Undibacterium seohonense]
MKCPVCENSNLLMSERQGIEIDYCPQCRGVWLDRGELDKIIERSGVVAPLPKTETQSAVQVQAPAYPQPQAQPQHQTQTHYPQQQRQHSGYSQPQHSHSGHYKKKKEGFLSELFDFD